MPESIVDRLFHQTPFWLLALAIFGGMALAAATGLWLRRRRDRMLGEKTDDEESKEGLVVSSVMGLLALLIGFTFSLAIDRFDTRRERVLAEANAISTAYLRAQLLGAPHRERIGKLLVQYTDVSIALAQVGPGSEQQARQTRNDALVVDLWAATTAAFPTIRSYDFSSTFLDSVNSLMRRITEWREGVNNSVHVTRLIHMYFR